MIGSMCQLQECMVTLLLRTTRMRSQLLGRVSGVAVSQTNKQTNPFPVPAVLVWSTTWVWVLPTTPLQALVVLSFHTPLQTRCSPPPPLDKDSSSMGRALVHLSIPLFLVSGHLGICALPLISCFWRLWDLCIAPYISFLDEWFVHCPLFLVSGDFGICALANARHSAVHRTGWRLVGCTVRFTL